MTIGAGVNPWAHYLALERMRFERNDLACGLCANCYSERWRVVPVHPGEECPVCGTVKAVEVPAR